MGWRRGGLSYFDGHSWSTIQTPTDSLNVLSLTEARDGALWVATFGQGLFRYGGGEWTRFGPEEGLPGWGFVQIIQASDGSIWATALEETPIARYKNDVWTVYRTQDGLSERRHDSIWEGRDGRLWSVSANGDFVTFNGERWRGVDSARKPTSFATHVEVARDGTLWVYGSHQPIAYRVRLEEAPRTRFDVGPVLRGGHRAGATWFATDDGPVRFDGRHWFLYGPEDGLLDSPYTSSVATEDGSVWFQADQGWCRYIQGRWEVHLTSEIGLDRLTSSSSAVAYRHKDGSFWVVGSRDGKAAVSRYDPALPVWKVHQPDILAERFHQTFVAANGDIWFSTNPWLWAAANQGEGAVRYDGDSWTHYTTDDGLLHNRIYGFGQSPDGKVWAGTPWGLSWFDGTKWESYGDGIPGEKPQRFQVAGEDLWCAYRPPAPTGVSRYDGATWHTYTKDDGLASNLVLHILPASDGTVWLATQEGISRFSPVTQTWSSYTEDDGIAPGVIERLWETEDGIGYTARNGVAGILRADTDAPRSAFNVAPTDVGSSGNVILTWSARDRWDVTPPGQVRYQYRLDNEEWSSETNRTDVTLTSLSPGSHRIELRAIDDELNIEATPIVHAFVVEAPWWRNPVVAGPGLLIIAIALFQSARVVQRDKRLREGNQALSDANKELFQVNVDLQREQVLERLRGQAQGMQSSEDIGPVVEAVYRELGGLGLSLISSNITMQISENETQVWVTNEDGQAVAPFTRETQGLSRDEAALKQGGAYTHTQRVGEEMRLSIRRMIARGHPRWKGVPEDRWPGKGESYRILIEQGSTIGILSEEEVDEDILMLIRRFGEVFVFAHSRWQELQEKEAQNQELKNQNVLERLRGQAQGMQSSGDIKPVVEAVYRELTELGLPLIRSGFSIYLLETEIERWTTGEDGRALEPFIIERRAGSPVQEALRRGDDYHHRHIEGEDVKEAIRGTIERGNPRWKGVPEERWPQRSDIYNVFFEGGNVGLGSEEPIAEEYLMLVKRFGEVFGFAHSRYRELQEKEAQNKRLAVEASVQRLRAEVQSMDEASDFERILSLLTESLKTVELSFDGCEIDVLDEPVENPTMELFEANGFKYATYTLDTDGHVAVEAFAVAAPFPGVIRQTVERFIAGEPWQAVVEEDTTILEVPAGSYGRLRLIASGRERFDADEIATLREFADAVALGYARYLDIREIQDQTERKSAFLASMSHEFRTPMNAIKGFTNLVLRRGKDELSERNQENLQKVDQASDHLLAMINDLLDLSKIEAGRMDVNPERFDVGELVTSACDTVSPLIQEGVELHRDVADDIGEANTDKARLQQMVINLLSNAIKFTDSGSVTVTASRGPSSAEATAGRQGAGSGGEDLVIAVSDTGKGIPAKELPTIFDEYRQAEGSESSVQKGTGLGLSITRKFAELLGGTIGVESEVGKGSTFTIRVPVEYRERV